MFMISPQTFLYAWHEGMRLHSQLFGWWSPFTHMHIAQPLRSPCG
jgi:hypothetical protein